ncbi:hypothetical protein NMG60_11026189 [Bertholletia excelsa]
MVLVFRYNFEISVHELGSRIPRAIGNNLIYFKMFTYLLILTYECVYARSKKSCDGILRMWRVTFDANQETGVSGCGSDRSLFSQRPLREGNVETQVSFLNDHH